MTSLSHEIQNAVESFLRCKISGVRSLPGGCINEAFRLSTSSGEFFIKINSSSSYPGMFRAEARGLRLLAAANAVRIPKVLLEGETNGIQFLLLEFLEPGIRKPGFFEEFGRQLARMHKTTNEKFGLDHDNYIGSLPQTNDYRKTWKEFFTEKRLYPQFESALRSGKLSKQFSSKLENLCDKLDELFPDDPPALLHGDLWNGNFLTGPDGSAAILDPAVYFGHREMDLAMSRLFGGFHSTFYVGYHEEYPLDRDWQKRIPICNLYPLLVHFNLFGGGYASDVQQILMGY